MRMRRATRACPAVLIPQGEDAATLPTDGTGDVVYREITTNWYATAAEVIVTEAKISEMIRRVALVLNY